MVLISAWIDFNNFSIEKRLKKVFFCKIYTKIKIINIISEIKNITVPRVIKNLDLSTNIKVKP